MRKLILGLILIIAGQSLLQAQPWYDLMMGDNPNLYEVKQAYRDYWQNKPFKKSGKTQYYKQWVERMEQFAGPDGYYQTPQWNTTNEQNYFAKHSIPKPLKSSGSRSTSWYEIGPWTWDKNAVSVGGSHAPGITRMNTVEQDPNNPNTIYAGTAQAGLWKSTDNGDSWTNLTGSLLVKGVGAIEINHQNANVVFFSGETGLYRSTDGGMNWTVTSLSYNYYDGWKGWDIRMHPTDTTILFLAANDGLYRSTDAGLNWTSLTSIYHLEIEFHPTDPNIIYVVQRTNGSRCDFRKSTDGGNTFTTITNGTPNPTGNQNTQRMEIDVTPAAPDNVYIMAPGNANGNGDGLYGFYVSTDAGDSFTFTCCGTGPGGVPDTVNTNIMTWNCDGADTGGQIWYDVAMSVSDSDPNTIFTGGVNVWKSTDRGNLFTCNAHWSIWSSWPGTQQRYTHADIHDIKIFGNKIWVVSDGGIFLSTDNGDNFTDKTEGIQGTEFWGMGAGFQDGDVIIGGSVHNGTMLTDGKSYDGWFSIFGGDSWNGYVNYGDPKVLYADNAGGTYRKIILSGDAAIAPTKINWPGHGYSSSSGVEFHPAYYNQLYQFVSDTLRYSTDNGSAWENLGVVTGLGDVPTLRIAPNDPMVLYVANSDAPNMVYRSADGGKNWVDVSPSGSLTGNYDFPRLNAMCVDAQDPNTVWVVIGGHHAGNKVIKTIDGGSTWTDYSGTLPDEALYSIVHQHGTDGGVYVGSDLAVYYRNNSMSDWIMYSDELPILRSVGLQVWYGEQKLRAFSRGRGVWEADVYESGSPIAQIAANTNFLNCTRDSVQFVDHSTMASDGANWQWTFPGGTPSASTDQNPVVYYSQSGTYDVTLTVSNSFGSNSQTYQDFITVDNQCDVDPFPGMAVQLDGDNDHVFIPQISLDSFNVTFMCWVWPDGIQGEYSGIIFDKNESAGVNFRPNNEIGYHWPGGQWWWSSGLVAPVNEWSHVAIVTTRDSIRVYLNGVGQTHVVTPGAVGWTNLQVGTYKNWGGRHVKGKIDEVAVYNRSLTQDEIREHMHLTKAPSDPDLLVYYQFNEANGAALNKVGAEHGEIFNGGYRVASSAPIAGGASARMDLTTAGSFDFTGTGLVIDLPADGTFPNGEVVVSRLEWYPDEQPDCIHDPTDVYWVANNYGTESAFTMADAITFNNKLVTPLGLPNGYTLYQRAFNGEGNTWLALSQSSQAMAGQQGSLTFEVGNGVTSFGQFMMGNSQVYEVVGICEGASAIIYGTPQTQAGVYVDSLMSNGGCDSVLVTELTVDPKPQTPVISAISNDSLTASTTAQSYEWYFDGMLVPGATTQSIAVFENGKYQVVVFNGGCASDTSEVYVRAVVGLDVVEQRLDLRVFPNPSKGVTHIWLQNLEQEPVQLELFDNLGRRIYRKQVKGTIIRETIALPYFADGVYNLQVMVGTTSYSHKLVFIQDKQFKD